MSRSNVTNFQPRLAFIMGHIFTKLHRLPISGFPNFVQIDAKTHGHITDASKNNTCSQIITTHTHAL